MSQLDSNYLNTYIEGLNLGAQLIEIDTPTPTVETAAQAVGTQPEKILKSLLFLIDNKPILVIASGTLPVDRRALAKHFQVGRKRVKLADASTVQAVTGYEVGGVPPIGHLTSLKVIIDEQALKHDLVYGGGGGINSLLAIDPQEIVSCTGAEPINLHG
jgi:Cys-tRNA(Pro) deacylase